MRLWLLALFFAAPIYAASLPCTIIIDANGNALASCTGVAPTSTPSPAPTPAPAPVPPPPSGSCASVNVVHQEMFLGGSNNWVFDDAGWRNPSRTPSPLGAQGTIQAFAIPATWRDGVPTKGFQIQFSDTPSYNPSGAQYEVAFSKCAGDFEYYKSEAASVTQFGQKFYPCGFVRGADSVISWGAVGDYQTCQIPAGGGGWYMNWRATNCSTQCGQVWYVPYNP